MGSLSFVRSQLLFLCLGCTTLLGVSACGSSRQVDTDGGTNADSAIDLDSGTPDGAVQCGSTTCADGLVCCNPSCGICTEPEGSCIQVECTDGGIEPDGGGGCTTPILCAAPPAGCYYVGGSCLSCGTLVCETACGGDSTIVCSPTEYCNYESGCGFADEPGKCDPRPDACPDIYSPVCGCDGETYGNDCEAASRGMDVLHPGECESEEVCGTIAGLTCSANEWCDYTDCRVADAGGTCQPKPFACPRILDPVCGCDGNTYSNECDANAAGMDILYRGECGSVDCEPMDARGVGMCDAFFGFAWNGFQCAGISGCSCRGDDCRSLYADRVTCQADHDRCVRVLPGG